MPTDDIANDTLSSLPRGEFDCFIAGEHDENCVIKICPVCKRPFCEDHASQVDAEFCHICLTPTDASVERTPLVDDEGVTHVGTVIQPTGPAYKTLLQRIAEMDEYQLRDHITTWKMKVHEAEQVLDYRRIALGSSQIQLAELEEAKKRKLRGVRVTTSRSKISISATRSAGSVDPKAAALANIMRQAGVDSPEKMKAFLERLQAAGAAAKNGVKK